MVPASPPASGTDSAAPLGAGGDHGCRPDLPRGPGPVPLHAVEGLGRPHDLGGPGQIPARRGDGRRRRAQAARLVRQPPVVSPADARRPGRRPGGDRRGGGPALLPAPVRGVPARLAAADPRRRAVPRSRERGGGLDRRGRSPAAVPGLLQRRRRGERLQRPAAGVLLRRRPAVPAGVPAAPLRRPRGRTPAGRCRPHQDRGLPARRGGPGRGRAQDRPPVGEPARPAPAVAAPAQAPRPRRPAPGPGLCPARVLASRHSRGPLPGVQESLPVRPRTGDPGPRPVPRDAGAL